MPDRVCLVRREQASSSTALRIAHALLALAAVTVFAMTSLVLALAVARPLRALAAEAKRVGDGRPALPPTNTFVEEIQELEGAVGAMVERLRAREAEVHERLTHAQDANEALQRTNRTLAETRQQLLQAERLAAIGRLSAGLAHEIGNPLTAILSLLDLVLAGDLPEAQQRDFLERIRAENERIGTIVRGLLDFSRPDLPKLDAPEGSCLPLAVVDDLLRFFEPQRRYAHARFALTGDRLERPVRMQAGTLRQVLLNLFLNAAEALESQERQGIVLVMLEDAGDHVRILVEDDGPGVSSAVGDKLFEPFVSSKGDRGGTGLGLSICRGLVEAVGGRLDLERSSKAGTRFALTLPAERS
jgi:signal transduction histidine kinase